MAAYAERTKRAFHAEGPKGYARATAESLADESVPGRTPPVILAGYWARAGETDKAFEVLKGL